MNSIKETQMLGIKSDCPHKNICVGIVCNRCNRTIDDALRLERLELEAKRAQIDRKTCDKLFPEFNIENNRDCPHCAHDKGCIFPMITYPPFFIGEFQIYECKDQNVLWFQHDSGEGAQLDRKKFEETVMKFYKENF